MWCVSVCESYEQMSMSTSFAAGGGLAIVGGGGVWGRITYNIYTTTSDVSDSANDVQV